MSFDSFFDEAGSFNHAAAEDDMNEAQLENFDEDAMWDDDYDWTAGALRHEDMNYVDPHFMEDQHREF